jgi:Zn-dependent protease
MREPEASLRSVPPFRAIPEHILRELATQLVARPVKRGDALDGSIAIDPREPAAVIGLGTLLAHPPAIHAQHDAELLALPRAALVHAMRESPAFAEAIALRLQLELPLRRARGVVLHDEAQILAREGSSYFALSPVGRAVWEAIDGSATLRDVARAVMERVGFVPPDEVARVVARMVDARMVEADVLAADVPLAPVGGSLVRAHERTAHRSRVSRLLTAPRWTWRGAHAQVERLHRGGGFVLCRRPAVVLFVLLALIGSAPTLHRVLVGPRFVPTALELAILVALGLVQIALHELGHALALVHRGLRVHGAGVGWYWLMPVAFVDTSHAWTASRRDRIAVSLAGVLVNGAIGGLSAFFAMGLDAIESPASALAWQLALSSYLMLAFNLNPLLELDGYHVLSELVGRPQLREEAFAWLRREGVRTFASWRRHPLEATYASASIAFAIATVAALPLIWAHLAHDLSVSMRLVLAALALLAFAFTSRGLWSELAGHAPAFPSPVGSA